MENATHGMSSIIRADGVQTVIKGEYFSLVFSDNKTKCSVNYHERAKVGKLETNNCCISLEVWFLMKAISFALCTFFNL